MRTWQPSPSYRKRCARLRRALQHLRIRQAQAAKRIGKSEPLVSLVLRAELLSEPCLLLLEKLVLEERLKRQRARRAEAGAAAATDGRSP